MARKYKLQALDVFAQETPGFVFFGSGNTSDNYHLQQRFNGQHGLEIGIKEHFRQGFDIDVVGITGNRVDVLVPTGHQIADPARGVPSDHVNRAAWNFDFSITTGADGSDKKLDDYNFWMKLDIDPSEKVNYLLLKAVGGAGSESGIQWEVAANKKLADGSVINKGTVVIGDDSGNDQVTQNSFNYAFIRGLIDTDKSTDGIQAYAFGEATFDIKITGGGLSVHDRIHVSDDFIV